jgi:small membrane protein
MSVFQYLVLLLLLLLGSATVRGAVRGGIRKRVAAFWLLVWAGVGVASAWPESTVIAARTLGIGRGADLVMYCSVLAMLVGFFYIYTRFRRLDRSLTLLVRRIALDNALAPEAREPESRDPTHAES